MKHRYTMIHACVLGALALSANVMATDKESSRVFLKDGLTKPDAENMVLLSHHDMQGRPIYQPTVHKYPASLGGRMIFFAGLHAGTALNPMTGVNEPNGILIVDVTNPHKPVLLTHLPSLPPNQQGQMVRVCDGQNGVLGQTGKVYMLRSDGSGNGTGRHDVYDVTDPANPVFLSSP